MKGAFGNGGALPLFSRVPSDITLSE
jgi:hypothetical protein